MKRIPTFVMAALLIVLAACAPAAQASTPTSAATEQVTAEPIMFVTQGGPHVVPATHTPTPDKYQRPPAQVGNTPAVLTGDYPSVIFFTDTGESWGALLSRATREMVLGTDVPANVVAMLVFDVREKRNELVQVLANREEETQFKVDNGGLLISIDDWSAYHVELGAPFEDGIFAMREASLDLLADSVLDNRALSDAGQLCLPSGAEIGLLFPCTRPNATLIPSPTARP